MAIYMALQFIPSQEALLDRKGGRQFLLQFRSERASRVHDFHSLNKSPKHSTDQTQENPRQESQKHNKVQLKSQPNCQPAHKSLFVITASGEESQSEFRKRKRDEMSNFTRLLMVLLLTVTARGYPQDRNTRVKYSCCLYFIIFFVVLLIEFVVF